VTGTPMPLATTKEVMIQVDWSVEAPRLPAMVGSETLAMVVSSTCMMVASMIITVIRPRFGYSPFGPSWLISVS
jgi:hypothetical protein